jgi:hypothetical protein
MDSSVGSELFGSYPMFMPSGIKVLIHTSLSDSFVFVAPSAL